MIAHSAYNRTLIKDYLEIVGEDDFIDEVIIPLFAKHGYSVFRHNTHGPGEHGADIIFSRYIPIFLDAEYLVVQAKAEKVTTSNVSKFSDQLNRAYKNDFPGKSSAKLSANYALLINARKHTNDANVEFGKLTDNNNNIKILAQDNIIDMILRFDVQITSLKSTLELNDIVHLNFEDSIREIIFSGNNVLINKLLDKDLKIETRPLSGELQALIINYAFQKWTDNPTWEEIARPISWINVYFDFVQPFQYPKLVSIINEYTNGYRSKAALNDTTKVVYKITSEQIRTFELDFMNTVVRLIKDLRLSEYPALESKYFEYVNSKLASSAVLPIITVIEEFNNITKEIMTTQDTNEKQEIRKKLIPINSQLFYFLFPDQIGKSF